MNASEKIARLRELREAASANGWQVERCAVWCGSASCNMCWPGPGTWNVGSGYSPEDAAAIVAAMNSLDALLECASVLADIAAQKTGAELDEDQYEHADFEGGYGIVIDKARAALQALAEGGGE